MQLCVSDIVRERGRTITPRILLEIARIDIPMHLHDRRESTVLRPTHEKIGAVRFEIRILVTTNVMSPNRKSAHRSRVTGRHDAPEAIGLGIIRLVIPRPAGGILAGAGESAARKKNSVCA